MIVTDVAGAPNPQFVRPDRTDLTGEWQFHYDDDNIGLAHMWYLDRLENATTITVPYPPETPMSGIGDPGFHPVVWYQRVISLSERRTGDRVLLHFGAVDYHTMVWVDGSLVGEHTGAYTPFAFDLTDVVGDEATAVLVTVRVFDDPHDKEQPRGKQAWTREPAGIHYLRSTGIWQPVWLEVAPPLHISALRWGFDREHWLVTCDVELNERPAAPVTIEAVLELAPGIPVTASATALGRATTLAFDLSGVADWDDTAQLLWSPDRPNLHGARITLDPASPGSDTVLSYTGLRTIAVDRHGVYLNGHRTWLQFVLNQGYWPESGFASPSDDAIREDIELILALGFNGARTHQKAEDPRFLYWADRLGLLLWGEIGAAFTWSDRALSRHAEEWHDIVRRDRNHPSIIGWVPFNESWGVENLGGNAAQRHAVKAAYHFTHALDGTRPVIGNDGWENAAGDILTIHDYSWDAATLTERYGTGRTVADMASTYNVAARRLMAGDADYTDAPIMVTEYGGVSFAPEQGEEWYGYGKVTSTDDFIARYRDLTMALQESDALCGVCYTQFADTEQETNGLVDAGRNPKVDIRVLADIARGHESHG